MTLLLDRQGQLQITEDVVKAAAENGKYGKDIMALLLAEHRDQLLIIEDVIRAAARIIGKVGSISYNCSWPDEESRSRSQKI
ncbi:hypothetical protein IFM47457_03012 [Aspergillus lentulus]|nr:hypothetical protein IFM47457_03012 [Aspergillus lentulus]